LQYSNGKTSYLTPAFGSSSVGTSLTFNVPTGQFISSINVCPYSSKIVGLQFFTNLGQKSAFFGDTAYIYNCKVVNLPGGLTGIGGYNNSYINALYFLSNPQSKLTIGSGK